MDVTPSIHGTMPIKGGALNPATKKRHGYVSALYLVWSLISILVSVAILGMTKKVSDQNKQLIRDC